jgi:glycosyltransferase involved in cell wall biosynthesis
MTKYVHILKNVCSSLVTRSYSSLHFLFESTDWVMNWELKETMNIAQQLGVPSKIAHGFGFIKQSVFYSSKYILLNPKRYLFGDNKIALPYFHGYPSSGELHAVGCFEGLKKNHEKIQRVQVSHSTMHEIVLESGIDPSKVFRIPIAVNPEFFCVQTKESRIKYRELFDIPQQAVVVGSFQKDGNGFGPGNEPKLIKGPDIFLKTVEILKQSAPNLFVLLSGPARGYMKNGLERLKIPYKHIILDHYPEIGKLFQCLDLYIVSSREEGGPKAILESMISGIPLVTTRVGQANDLVKHEKNACMVEPEDFEGLAYWAEKILTGSSFQETLVRNGAKTAEQNTYSSHVPLWKGFFSEFIHTRI